MKSYKLSTLLKSPAFYSFVILALLFCVFAYFRFYNLDKRLTFDWDQQSFSKDIRNIIVAKDFTLLGPRVTDDKGFFLGPYFTYLLLPFYIASNLHPYGLIPFIVLVNVAFFFTSYFILKKIWSSFVALVFLSIWSIVPQLILNDITAWWPIFIPLGVVLNWYCLWRIYKKSSVINYVLLGIVTGFFSHMHFQFMYINIFTSIFLLTLYIQKKSTFSIKNIFVFIGVTLASLLPLFLFDLRHEFLNTNLFLSYFTDRIAGQKPDMYVWKEVFANFLYSLIWTKNLQVLHVFYVAILGILIYLLKTKTSFLRTFYIASAGLWIITYIGFTVYGRRPSEYYFNYLYPFIFVIIIDFLSSLKVKYISVGIAFILLMLNYKVLQTITEDHPYGLYYKDQAVKKILPYIQNKKYNVSLDMPLGGNNGYEYLLDVNGIHSSGDPKDPLIEIRVPARDEDIKIKDIGVHIPKELQ